MSSPMSRQVAVPDIAEAVKGAKFLVFVIPHQFINRLCDQMKPHVTEGTIGISLIKVNEPGRIKRGRRPRSGGFNL